MNPETYHGQVVIVTGASAGIGKALALSLARQGAKIVLAARRAERLQQVAEECRDLGGEALVVQMDVGVEKQCKTLIEKTIKTFGRIDMLINNAGFNVVSLFEDLPDLRLFKHCIDVNFFGSVNCIYFALPYLIQSKGRIVGISSTAGKTAIPYNSPYVSSKYAMHGFYDSLRMEMKRHGVGVTVICPWWVTTEFHTAQMNKNGIPRGEEHGRDLYKKGMMTPETCARIILNAAQKRRREVLMGPGWLVGWIKLLSPGLLDWITIKQFLEPAIKRAQRKQEESD